MNKRSTEENEPRSSSSLWMTDTVAYSARIQEAMRYDKLRSSDYPLVMSIMRAISQGLTEEQWKSEQKSTLKVLLEKPTDQHLVHTEAANRYEQTIAGLRDLVLWPW